MSVLLRLNLRYEEDVVAARQRARHIASLLGFDNQDQIRIATAVSEITRNAYEYAGGGKVEFSIEGGSVPTGLRIVVRDSGPGIRDVRAVLSGNYVSKTGMGLGLIGSKRIMDELAVDSSPGTGTTITMIKRLTRRATPLPLAQITAELARATSPNPFEETRQQNQELLHALSEVQLRRNELDNLNRELADTNRGVMALYAELEDKAQQLQHASDMKSAFLSGISHEFRTPLNSIIGLSRLLLARADGELTPEQEKQVHFIRLSAEMLSELVNDLLDTAKIEAGKITVQVREFTVEELFSTLRGMSRPLVQGSPATSSQQSAVALEFTDTAHLPVLHTDDSKVAQILRNLISNALKFTEQGSVTVSAELSGASDILFIVRDTGIGIAPENWDRIFREFEQVAGTHQRHIKGTGLGLPLSQKLAQLLGGVITVTSELGSGSTFQVVIPVRYPGSDVAITDEGESHA